MSNMFSLEDLKEDLDKEFAPLKLMVGETEVVFRNLMRLGKNERHDVMEALKSIEAANSDEEEEGQSVEDIDAMADAVDTVISTIPADGKGDLVRKAVAGDMAVAMKIMELWTEATQPGEAQNSPA